MSKTKYQGTNGLAIASFVISLFGISVLAIIFGHRAKSQIKQTGQSGSGLATAGLVIGYLTLLGQLYFFYVISSIQ